MQIIFKTDGTPDEREQRISAAYRHLIQVFMKDYLQEQVQEQEKEKAEAEKKGII